MGPVVRRFAPARTLAANPGAHAVHGAEIHWMAPGRAAGDIVAGAASLHMVWGGAQTLIIDGRSLRLDDETFLVLNPGHCLSLRGASAPSASMMSVYFDAEQLGQALRERPELTREAGPPGAPAHRLYEHLRERDKGVDAVMRFLAHHVCAGVEDAAWLEEQVEFLLRRLAANEAQLARQVSGMVRTKSHRRRETFLRLARVTDLIHSAYERQLSMEELAEAAHWSVFHMMREFKTAHGVSPYEYLQRRRTSVAARLLCSSELSVAEIAERVGFQERSTLMRRLRRMHGLGPRAMRELGAAPATQTRSRPNSAAIAGF